MDVTTEEWTNIKNESSQLHDHHRRIPNGLGGSDRLTVHTQKVDKHRQIESHQSFGIKDCFVCSTAMEKSVKKSDGIATTRQYNGCCLPSEGRGHTVQIATLPSGGDIDISRSTEHIGTTKLPARSDEYAGRCSVVVEGTQRMDAGCRSSSEDIYNIQATSGRPICITDKQAVEPILLYGQARPSIPGDGRTTPRLELPEQATVRFSPP